MSHRYACICRNALLPLATVLLTTLSFADSVVVFHSDRDGNSEIYRISADGRDERRLTDNGAYDGFPSWSPDGSQILFQSDRNDFDGIYVMNADGSDPRPIPNTSAGRYPKWSPDGRHIAFFAERDGRTDVYVVNVDGSEPRNLTNSNSIDETPSWTADSTRLAFQSDREWRNSVGEQMAAEQRSTFGLYTMAANGSDVREITDLEFNDENPSISPDGARIVFQRYVADGLAIAIADTRNGQSELLTSQDEINASPAYSNTGKQIVFDTNEDGNFEIFVMRSDGTGRRQLTFTDGNTENSGAAIYDNSR